MIEMKLMSVYETLLDSFGKQDWWPCSGSFSPPEWEICVGAVLTQNTNWTNVEKALENMKRAGKTDIMDLLGMKSMELEKLVRPSGFYKQKAERLKILADFVAGFGGFRGFAEKIEREHLLKVKGIGPETADSILLYAVGRPVFVIDAYTRRVFGRLGNIRGLESPAAKTKGKKQPFGYEEWRNFFESDLPKDAELYKEFHALVVELAKRHCRKRPECEGCPLNKGCKKII